jgi:hypothetical protein
VGLVLRVTPDLIPADRDSNKANEDATESNNFIDTGISKVTEKPQDRHP